MQSTSRLSTLKSNTYPSTKAAQDAPTVAVMAVGGTIGLDAAAWVEASDAIEARLREAGYRIDDSGLPRRDDCAELPCLRGERADRNVDVLVTLTIFAAEGGTDAAGSIVVTMVDADGQYVGEELVEGRVIGVVAALALASARSERERGPEPWVRVSGTPAGAVVVIDGREVGVVPYEGRVEAGEHRVSVRLSGYETFERRFTARSGSTSPRRTASRQSPRRARASTTRRARLAQWTRCVASQTSTTATAPPSALAQVCAATDAEVLSSVATR